MDPVVLQKIIFIFTLFLGLFIYLKPEQTIEIQRRFYEKINWRVEPISMTKEVRNTKAMGLLLIFMPSWAWVYISILIS